MGRVGQCKIKGYYFMYGQVINLQWWMLRVLKFCLSDFIGSVRLTFQLVLLVYYFKENILSCLTLKM